MENPQQPDAPTLAESSPTPDLDSPPATGASGVDPTFPVLGTHIGRYKLLQKIGEGGWGVVYMAEQEEPGRRRLALKIIKLGMDTKTVIARFEAERQALAMMDHPNIARVLDAGATETGRPFFVMELVRGISVTAYCDQHSLPMKDRLHLFVQVCQAVQHAHQKGIVHRDLKPSNILVSHDDGRPVPKVIDFGIAKAGQRTGGGCRSFFEGGAGCRAPTESDLQDAQTGPTPPRRGRGGGGHRDCDGRRPGRRDLAVSGKEAGVADRAGRRDGENAVARRGAGGAGVGVAAAGGS